LAPLNNTRPNDHNVLINRLLNWITNKLIKLRKLVLINNGDDEEQRRD
jgi:hypothetical protein